VSEREPVAIEGIGNWIRRRAGKSRDFTAVVFRDRELTYAELSIRIDRLAAALAARGITKGSRVAYLGGNHPSFIESMFATTLLGAIFVPLNTRLAVPELQFQLDDSGASLLISTSAMETTAASATADRDIARISVDDPGSSDPAAVPDSVEDYESVISGSPQAFGVADPVQYPNRLSGVDDGVVSLEDPALIIYTSGTTGQPKGAVLTHGNLTWNALATIVDYDVTSRSRWILISPVFHVASLGMGMLPTLLKGATLLLQERFMPAEALAAIERLRATHISGVPTTYQMMMEDPGWDQADISSLETMTCGGSAVPRHVIDAYAARGLAFSGGYGMTEAAPGVAMIPPWEAERKVGSSGMQMFFTHFRIRDLETGEIVGPGRHGEIETAGPNIMRGYWNRPQATDEAFTDDGWFKTGDVGIADEDGFLTIVDRAKDMIISGGENVYSAEVELAIVAIEGVTGAAVLGVPDDRWGEVPHAVVTLAPGVELTLEGLVERLTSRLARYKIPKSLEVVDDLPRTASGKVQKQELRRTRL
jgi:fatty-acyl-CoA synthase